MKVLNIGDNVVFGHRFNGHDLSISLRSRGIDAQHLVWWKNLEEPNTHEIASDWRDRAGARDYFTEINLYYGSHGLFYPFYYQLLFNQQFLESDVIHFQLLHNSFFGMEHLPLLSRIKPVVWTLHDPWAITGHCVHPLHCERWQAGCGDCPMLDLTFSLRQDTTALNWEYKRLIFQSSDLDIVVASQWMFDRIRKSPLFQNARLHLVNFGIDLDQFKPHEDPRQARQKLGIPDENVVIAFRAFSSVYKGLDYVKECLRGLSTSQPVTLLTFHEKGLVQEFADRFQIIELGWVDDDALMVEAYGAADIFLMPSLAEAFGMMGIEAMACGRPVIAMEGTALAEVLRSEESGCVVVPQGDVNEMRSQLERFLQDPALRARVGSRSREVAEQCYSQDRYTSEIIAVYEKAIARKQGDSRAAYLIAQQKKLVLPGFQVPLFQEKVVEKIVEKVIEKVIEKEIIVNQQVTDKEYKLISWLRRLKSVPLVHFAYVHIAKPAFRLLKALRFLFVPK